MIFTKEYILELLNELNERLQQKDIIGDIVLYGGAVMCLQYNAREFTQNIDAYLSPKEDIEKIAEQIASERNIPLDWINDSVLQFTAENEQLKIFMQLSNLKIYTASPKYLLALKIQSFRIGISSDEDDIQFLLNELKITTVQEVIDIIELFFPKGYLNQRTQFDIQYLIEDTNKLS